MKTQRLEKDTLIKRINGIQAEFSELCRLVIENGVNLLAR